MKALVDKNYEHVDWEHFKIPGKRMIRVYTIPDGNCLFHAIANSYFEPYRKGILQGKPITQQEIVRSFRTDLAYLLKQKSASNPSKTNYEMLGNGAVMSMSETLPCFSLGNMQKELMNNSPVDNLYNEHVSNCINKDIYILSADKQDVYMFGDDYRLLYKNRDSLVIIYLEGHYEMIALQDQNTGMERSLFPYNHPFINLIRKRMEQLCSGSFVMVDHMMNDKIR